MNSIAPIVSLSGTLLKAFVKKEDSLEFDKKSQLYYKTIRGLGTIHDQGQKLMEFTESYRRLSYLQAPVFKWFSLSDLIEKLMDLFKDQLQNEYISYEVKLFQSQINIYADEKQLSLVIINLLKNAIESLQGVDKERFISVKVTDGDYYLISVIDNGLGVPRAIQEAIFVPFYTTKKTGSGIGLSISRQIVCMHGGDLTLQSNPGEKTVFTISLPNTAIFN